MAWTSPRTWAVGERITAALQNTHVRDNLNAIGDPWDAVTPTYTNFSIGNGTVAAAYRTYGKMCHYRGRIVLGSTSSVTGTIRISLPATAEVTNIRHALGTVNLYDDSAGQAYNRFALHQSGTEFFMQSENGTSVNATVPFTFATSDTISWNFTYEVA